MCYVFRYSYDLTREYEIHLLQCFLSHLNIENFWNLWILTKYAYLQRPWRVNLRCALPLYVFAAYAHIFIKRFKYDSAKNWTKKKIVSISAAVSAISLPLLFFLFFVQFPLHHKSKILFFLLPYLFLTNAKQLLKPALHHAFRKQLKSLNFFHKLTLQFCISPWEDWWKDWCFYATITALVCPKAAH